MSAQLNTRRIVLKKVTPDQRNGTETRSNLIAHCFWKKLGCILHRFKSRRCLNELYNMFISSSHFSEDLKETPRCFNQVLFSLVHDGLVCRVRQGQILWKYNWRLCDQLVVTKEKSCAGMELNDHVRDVADMFFMENNHSLRWLKNQHEIKFFYELWSTTHDDVVLSCESPDRHDTRIKTDPAEAVRMVGPPLFGRILFALSRKNECRVISRRGRPPVVHWTMNDQFYQKKPHYE